MVMALSVSTPQGVSVWSISTHRVYLYGDGLVRICTTPYKRPDPDNLVSLITARLCVCARVYVYVCVCVSVHVCVCKCVCV